MTSPELCPVPEPAFSESHAASPIALFLTPLQRWTVEVLDGKDHGFALPLCCSGRKCELPFPAVGSCLQRSKCKAHKPAQHEISCFEYLSTLGLHRQLCTPPPEMAPSLWSTAVNKAESSLCHNASEYPAIANPFLLWRSMMKRQDHASPWPSHSSDVLHHSGPGLAQSCRTCVVPGQVWYITCQSPNPNSAPLLHSAAAIAGSDSTHVTSSLLFVSCPLLISCHHALMA